MIFQLCLVIFIASAASFESSDGRKNGLDINHKASLRVDGEGGADILGGEGKRRRKRSSTTIRDGTIRSSVLSVFNGQRRLVGASDMNYVGWNYGFENAAINWTSACNYDAYSKLPNASYFIRATRSADSTEAQVVQELFNLTDFYYAMRSTYVTGICVVKSSCSPAVADGSLYQQLNMYAILLQIASGFDETLPQYTLGPACSHCSSGISWCYNDLCSGKCDFNTTGCCQITESKAIGQCVTPVPTTSTTPTLSVAYSSNTLKFEIMLLGLIMSVLFAIVW